MSKNSIGRFVGFGILIGIIIGIIIFVYLFPEKFGEHWTQSGNKSLLLIAGIILVVMGDFFSRGKTVVVNLVLGAYIMGAVFILIGLWHTFALLIKTYAWIGIIGGGIVGGIGGKIVYRLSQKQ